MHDQDHELRATYGEAMIYAHLIEDLAAAHLYECSYFHVNGYGGLSKKKIRDLRHQDRLDELLRVYQTKKDPPIRSIVPALHILRKIRNDLTHALFPEVGSDFRTEEGLEQIIAML